MKYKLVLLSIILLASFSRLYKLAEFPNGFYADEAAIGYSAYSIYKTGKDEFGESLPVIFKSFSDFKTPIYIYLTSISIYFFDLNIFSVRIVSAIAGIATIVVFYFLSKYYLTNYFKSTKPHAPLIATLLLAISPWHILFSRSAFETNVALFFYLSALLAFYIGQTKKNILMLSAFLFSLSLISYHSFRIIVPITLIFLGIKYKEIVFLKSNFKVLILSFLLGIVVLFPTIMISNTSGFSARALGLSIFSEPNGIINNLPTNHILNDKKMLSLKEYSSLYITYLTPRNMFILGDSDRRMKIPEIGSFYLWQTPFYLFGLYLILRNFKKVIQSNDIVFLLLVSPIPAAFTGDPYSLIRSETILIPQILVITIGIKYVYSYFINLGTKYKFVIKRISTLVFCLLIIYSCARLYSSFFVLMPYYNASNWHYGWDKVSNVLRQNSYNNLPIVIDNSRHESYIYIAFFLKIDPLDFQNGNQLVTNYYNDLVHIHDKSFLNIYTRGINWEKDLLVEQILVADNLGISNEQIKNHNLEIIDDVKYPDGSVAFRIVRTPSPSSK